MVPPPPDPAVTAVAANLLPTALARYHRSRGRAIQVLPNILIVLRPVRLLDCWLIFLILHLRFGQLLENRLPLTQQPLQLHLPVQTLGLGLPARQPFLHVLQAVLDAALAAHLLDRVLLLGIGRTTRRWAVEAGVSGFAAVGAIAHAAAIPAVVARLATCVANAPLRHVASAKKKQSMLQRKWLRTGTS